jgi:hypothetical protein
MALVNAFGNLALDSTVLGISTQLGIGVSVTPSNIKSKFRESFESFTPGEKWNLNTASGDIVQLDGNAVSASYLVISKDPLTTSGITTLTILNSFKIPLETAVGLHMSQRTLGQELSMEVVSTETPLDLESDVGISSISQSTTTLTVTTTSPHNLVPGKRIGIYGVSDSRFNYPSLVVSSLNSSTQFTVTAGPGGTIPSITATGPNNSGFVYFRSSLGYSRNGMSEVFENTTVTNASQYTRSSSGDTLPTGTVNANHSITVATTASTQAINSAYTYAFLPLSEYRYILQADRAQFLDTTVDTSSGPTNRTLRTQVVPETSKEYKLRFRFTNNKGLTVPTAKIISAVKSASTTATITTDIPHGLTTTDQIVIYGISNQTNFANLTTATVVASTPTPTTFTIAFGASATATSYGGMVSRVQGGNIPTGYNTVAIQSAANDGTELILVGSANWAWLVGDYINVYGCRDNSTGADLGVDGPYKVVFVSTTTMRLIPIGSTVLPATFGTTNAGGTTIRRTDARISFVRIFDYERERVEVQSNGAAAASIPAQITNSPAVTVSSGSIRPINDNIYTLLTSTNLGVGIAFTGTSTNAAATITSASVYPVAVGIAVQHTAGLTPGTLVYEVGSETSSTAPTVWYPQFVVPIPSNASWHNFVVPLTSRYYRLRFTNGSTAQTNFRLATQTYYNGSPSNNLTYPDQILYPLSTTNLGIGSTFTGSTLDFGDSNNIYKTIDAIAFADQASGTDGFQIQVSRDATNWRVSSQVTANANTLTTISSNLVYRYARVVYTNGASGQGSFSLDARVLV